MKAEYHGPVISVIICTHNPRRDYFSRCLQALKVQCLSQEKWELLVVDNASSEAVEVVADLCWHGNARIIREDRLGLTPARLRGVRESQGELLIFVDDDNVLDANYLEEALRVARGRTFLGSWSGQCRPAFETTPPEWTRRYWGNLVIREFGFDRWSNLPRLAETMPCGAGLCVRREVAERYVQLHANGQRGLQLDRAGDSLISGGDNDLAACACALSLGVGLVASLNLTHLIPRERLTADYLARLAEGIHFSAVVLDGLYVPSEAFSRSTVRWSHRLRALINRQPHRTIQLAALRGRRRGTEWLRKNM